MSPPSADLIAVLGMGALGRLYAARLALSGTQVSPLHPRHQDDCNYRLTDAHGEHNLRLRWGWPLLPPQALLVTVKAYQVVTALTPWAPQIRNLRLPLILLHNGMGTLAPCQALLGEQVPILLASSTHGALRDEQGHVRHTGLGATTIGHGAGPSLSPLFQQALCDLLERALPPLFWTDHIEQALWLKLAINAVINPLTALHQCPNGALAEGRFADQRQHLIAELAGFFSHAGIALDEARLTATIDATIAATAGNLSSMNRDLAAGRRTEIDAITGHLLAEARQHGLVLEQHQRLYDAIKHAEQQ
ncbi:MAG: 2-dehydropantoate 2-reductase [Gammaproteobacteria bacterium]|nr:2-dehydropantoate 2-reductase [Gammaproteobacteria bacterium]